VEPLIERLTRSVPAIFRRYRGHRTIGYDAARRCDPVSTREPAQRGPRQPFDSTAKLLVAADPLAWLVLAGLPADGPVRSVDAGLDTIRAQADAVLRVGRSSPWFLHVELQTGRDRHLPERIHRYNVLLFERERRPIISMIVLLRPRADGPELTGHVERHDPTGRIYESFTYQVVRPWTLPTETLLTGPLGTLPLAPLPELFAVGQPASARRARVRAVIEQVDRRLRVELPAGEADDFRVATQFLLGLRYSQIVSEQLTRGVWSMLNLMDSSTYRAAVRSGEALGEARGQARGRIEEARRLLVRFAERSLGPVPDTARAALAAIDDVDELERLVDRLPNARTWDELLAL
jgi:predicted transposase YdaD